MIPTRTTTRVITISWDDGSVHDLRMAELMARYGLAGTFYIPRSSPAQVMSPAQMRALAAGFEIGAHTLSHCRLDGVNPEQGRQEIVESKRWVEDETGQPCRMFCFPEGRYSRASLHAVAGAGFMGCRTVELLALGWPRFCSGELLMVPTTLLADVPDWQPYARNLVRRMTLGRLPLLLPLARAQSLAAMVRWCLERVHQHGGVLHLWGHSAHVEANKLWSDLEDCFRILQGALTDCYSVTNGELCEFARQREARGPLGLA